jgi:inorganic pyrophosphatase
MNYWDVLDDLLNKNGYVIDRPKGTKHPRFDSFIYVVDYGYIKNSRSIDGNEIDLFVGTSTSNFVNGIYCTIDTMKNDSEIKIVYKCTDSEIDQIEMLLNNSKYMKAVYLKNPNNP